MQGEEPNDLNIEPSINSQATLETRVYSVTTIGSAKQAVNKAKNKYTDEFGIEFSNLIASTLDETDAPPHIRDGSVYIIAVIPRVWDRREL